MAPSESPTKLPMVRWYQPMLLLRTGGRALLATLIGQLADNRELQSNDYRGSPEILDYSNHSSQGPRGQSNDTHKNEFWLDFVADLGDGWEGTHAVATQVARQSLSHSHEQLPRANILLLGGDEVYPDPSQDAYLTRTFAPYQAACQDEDEFSADVLAIPGNHDWYDGLHAFEDVFCHDSADTPEWPFGYWHKRQKQSYFALKLPHGWWLLAPDTQLDHRLNPSQRNFFINVTSQMHANDRVIIVSPQPDWEMSEPAGSLTIVKKLAAECYNNGAKVKLVLSGDLHHYARFAADEGPMLVTSGGGGAFKHPTHTIEHNLVVTGLNPGSSRPHSTDYQQKALYPTPQVSKKLSLRNLLFPIINWELSLLIGIIYTLLAWVLETRNLVGDSQISALFEDMLANHDSVFEFLTRLFAMLPKSPEFALVILLTTAGLIAFNNNCTRATAIGLGIFHTAMHLFGLILTYCTAVAISSWLQVQFATLGFSFLWFLLTMVLFGGGVGGVVFGLFLLFSLNAFGANLTNAFSSLRISGYLNFLRLRFSPDGTLILYPFGIDSPSPSHQPNDQTAKPIEPPVHIV